jgi:hypothetical protein
LSLISPASIASLWVACLNGDESYKEMGNIGNYVKISSFRLLLYLNHQWRQSCYEGSKT